MEPVIPKRKKVPVIYHYDVHKQVAEPVMQRKKRDQSSSPIKYNNEPDFQSKRKFEKLYKNQVTNESPQDIEKSHVIVNKNSTNNLDSWPSRLRKSKSAHNIGRSRNHSNLKNIANMLPAGLATNIPSLGEYALLDNKVPYRLKSSNFPMSNLTIQDLYRPVFAKDSDYIILKNNVPYHLKKHSHLISKNDETGNWWINDSDATVSSQNPDHKNYNPTQRHNEFPIKQDDNIPKYRRSQSHGDLNHRRKFYKDEKRGTDIEEKYATNKQSSSHSKNHSTQTENKNKENNDKQSNGLIISEKNLKPPPKVNVITVPVVNKTRSPEPKNNNFSSNNKIKNDDKNLMITKSDVANYVAQKHNEHKLRLKNPDIRPTSVEKRVEKINHKIHSNHERKNIAVKIPPNNEILKKKKVPTAALR